MKGLTCRARRAAPVAKKRVSGAVLIIALILVGVIAFSSAMAMRLALFGDLVSQNVRTQSLALQAAEAALRYCEGLVVASPDTTRMLVGSGDATDGREWSGSANWATFGQDVPSATLGTSVNYGLLPRCMVRHLTLDEYRAATPPTPASVSAESRGIDPDRFVFYRVTARGYSPDFRSGGAGGAGAEVWLQSMIRSVR